MTLINKRQRSEFDHMIAVRNESITEENIDLTQKMLKELARRLLKWSQSIKEKNPDIEIGNNILFDVAFAITGKRVELPHINNVSLSYFDKLILASYFNWKEEEKKIRSKGYELSNPYPPYIEIFKLGGHLLKFEYTRLEVYPFIGINIFPKEDFIVDTPFWIDGEATLL